MLSSVLNSERAVQVNIEIMRTFVRLREILASNAELTRRLDALDRSQFKLKMIFGSPRRATTLNSRAAVAGIYGWFRNTLILPR